MSSEEQIGELVKLAGRREMPGAAQMSRARAAARAEWMYAVTHRRRPFFLWALGSAAIVAAGLPAAVWFRGEAPRMVSPVQVATLEMAAGGVRVTRGGSSVSTAIARGERLLAGDRLETPDGARAAISLPATAVKLDAGSSVLLEHGRGLTLESGAVFVDAGAGARGAQMEVRTSLGVVRHLGTQFEVRLKDGGLGVSVRDGTIAVENEDGRWISHEGEALRIVPGRAIERRRLPTDGAAWIWVNDLAPAFVLEGATLGSFLDWAARHHGLRWRYADAAMKGRVERIVLHGSIDDLSAEEALEAVLRTCGLTYRRDQNRLIVIGPAP